MTQRRCKVCGVVLKTGTAAAVDAARRPEPVNALEGSAYCLRHEPQDGFGRHYGRTMSAGR